MISKERLSKLISNCNVIYSIEFDKIEIYDLSDKDITLSPRIDYALRVYGCLGDSWYDIKSEDLFETRKQAEQKLKEMQ